MVEVFKTNVEDQHVSESLIALIHNSFDGYKANFDLMDCDNILRIQTTNGSPVEPHLFIKLLNDHGFEASVLPDEILNTGLLV